MTQITTFSISIFFVSSLCCFAQLQASGGCQSFPCRDLGILDPPFFSGTSTGCELEQIEVDCYHKKIKLGNKSQWYDVLTIDKSRNEINNYFSIRDDLLQERLESKSCDYFKNIALPLPSSSFISYEVENSHTFIMCTRNSKDTTDYFGGYYNYTGCSGYSLYYTYPYDGAFLTLRAALPPNCSFIEVPVVESRPVSNYEYQKKVVKSNPENYSDPFQIITAVHMVKWQLLQECIECRNYSGGKCSTNKYQKFQCIYLEQGTPPTKRRPTKLLIGGTFGIAILILIAAVLSLRKKIAMMSRKIIAMMWRKIIAIMRKIKKNFSSLRSKRYRYSDIQKIVLKLRKATKSHRTVKSFLRDYGSIGPKRYRYSEIKKMTNYFKDKLGEGGYGSVYKGKLSNGSLVAVKVIKESKGDGQEFFNEVASISRTSHVNVVTLLGFCIEGRKRALLYEFMPNGSLDKFLFNEISSMNCQLGWDKSYRIAIGIARGLEYLHRGCNTQIVHFDIKPHNILLDEDFVPKISDFGLAKLCHGKESAVSMLHARGTIGYIAPEVYCRNIGRVSNKSDVYSYGMMVIEMVGWRKNVEVEVGHTSEIYFPDWIYRKLESEKEPGTYGIVNEDENVYARKMIIVSLWCIQSDPSTRPSMSRVVEMLEGSLESLEIPPKPVLSSPPLSLAHSSTIEIS